MLLSSRVKPVYENPLNPEAGHVPVPSDARELAASQRAAAKRWRCFPYLGLRYGARGRRFTNSDSAWLCTLVEQPLPYVRDQVQWLGRVLAYRGMPRWLLEAHLELVTRELQRAVPERRKPYEQLRTMATELRGARLAALPEARWHSAARRFAARIGHPQGRLALGTGQLIGAAVADELQGLDGAIEALEQWLTDPERFDATFIVAVGETIRDAQS